MAKKKAAAKNRKKPESKWEQLGLVTIDTASLLLIDPVHAAAFDVSKVPADGEVVLDDAKRTAVVTTTGMGDGEYLVGGRYHEEIGMLAEIA